MSTAPVPEIDVHEAARLVEAGTVHLLDVREVDEWAEGRAPSAQHAAMSTLTMNDIPTDRPVLVICHLGGRSAMVVGQLVTAGIAATNVRGGMDAWAAAGLPVTV